MPHKRTGTHLDDRTQSTDLNRELVALNGEHRPLLRKALDADNVPHPNFIRAHRLSMDFIPWNIPLDIRSIQTFSSFLYGFAAFLHTVIVKLVLEGFDCLLCTAPRLPNNVVCLLTRLVHEFLT